MHTLSLKSVFKEAWAKVKGAKKAFFFLALAFAMVQSVFFFLKMFLENASKHDITLLNISITLLFMFIFGPLLTGLYMLGVKRARGETIMIKQGFSYFSKILPLFITQLFCAITVLGIFFCLTYTGFGILSFAIKLPPVIFHFSMTLLGLVYVMFFLTLLGLLNFSLILVADQNKSPWLAYKTSIKKALPYFKILFLAQLTFTLVELLGALLFGVGLVWAIPFSYITTGILYRKIFTPDQA